MNKVKAFWASLPHPVQAVIVAFGGGAGAEIGQLAAGYPNICLTGICLKHDIGLVVGAGIIAARAFYMVPNRAPAPRAALPASAE